MQPKKTTSPYIVVRNSVIHGRGVFAKCDIPKGTRIIEYVGERVTKAESDRRGKALLENHKKNTNIGAVYLFELNKRHDIDGNVPYNTARFINHSCDPSAETDIIRGKIWIIAIRDIKKGEEIFYNYGYGIDDYEDHPCQCRTNRCVGYIVSEDYWPKLRKKLQQKNSTQTVHTEHQN